MEMIKISVLKHTLMISGRRPDTTETEPAAEPAVDVVMIAADELCRDEKYSWWKMCWVSKTFNFGIEFLWELICFIAFIISYYSITLFLLLTSFHFFALVMQSILDSIFIVILCWLVCFSKNLNKINLKKLRSISWFHKMEKSIYRAHSKFLGSLFLGILRISKSRKFWTSMEMDQLGTFTPKLVWNGRV